MRQRPRHKVPWWHGTAGYQVYLPSFADGNGDGLGDLIGVHELLPRCPELETATERVRAFANMLMLVHRRGHPSALEAWITATVADGDPHLAGFARGCAATKPR